MFVLPLFPRPPYKSPFAFLPPTSRSSLCSFNPNPHAIHRSIPLRRMNSFDSTFESLALNYVGFGLLTVVNNIWTVLALATAAVSFWRLRGGANLLVHFPADRTLASSPEKESTSAAIDSRPQSSIRDAAEESTTAAVSAGAVVPPSPKIAAGPAARGFDDVTKGKFVTYCREDYRCDMAAAAGDDEWEVEWSGDRRCGGGDEDWWEGWEKALRIRTNGVGRGTGWYDYQDLAVLSGSVVRLWEEEKRKLAITSSMTSASYGTAFRRE